VAGAGTTVAACPSVATLGAGAALAVLAGRAVGTTIVATPGVLAGTAADRAVAAYPTVVALGVAVVGLSAASSCNCAGLSPSESGQ